MTTRRERDTKDIMNEILRRQVKEEEWISFTEELIKQDGDVVRNSLVRAAALILAAIQAYDAKTHE